MLHYDLFSMKCPPLNLSEHPVLRLLHVVKVGSGAKAAAAVLFLATHGVLYLATETERGFQGVRVASRPQRPEGHESRMGCGDRAVSKSPKWGVESGASRQFI